MDFSLNEDLELIVDTIRNFSNDRILPKIRVFESERKVDDDVSREFAAGGFDRLELPESLGGSGLGMLARVLVNEEMGAVDPGAALALDRLGPAFYVLEAFGGLKALSQFARPIVESEDKRAVLVLESDSTFDVEHGRVSGAVPWIPSARADLVVILSNSGARVVEHGSSLQPLRGSGLRAAGCASLRLEHAPVIAQWQDAHKAAESLAKARLYAASLLLGVLRQASEFSRSYAMNREAFGRPIAHHQGLAFLIVDMNTAVESVRLLVHDAALKIDRGEDGTQHAAAAFVEAVEASRFIGPNGVQILGGHGFMQDYPVEKAMRESRALGLWMGGIDRAKDDASKFIE
jgi:acyl-CoA dehydrogenase